MRSTRADPSLRSAGNWSHHPSVPPRRSRGPAGRSGQRTPSSAPRISRATDAAGRGGGGTAAAAATRATRAARAWRAATTTLRSERTMRRGSARLWFVRTAIVSPSIGKWRTAPRNPSSLPAVAEARMAVDRQRLDAEAVRDPGQVAVGPREVAEQERRSRPARARRRRTAPEPSGRCPRSCRPASRRRRRPSRPSGTGRRRCRRPGPSGGRAGLRARRPGSRRRAAACVRLARLVPGRSRGRAGRGAARGSSVASGLPVDPLRDQPEEQVVRVRVVPRLARRRQGLADEAQGVGRRPGPASGRAGGLDRSSGSGSSRRGRSCGRGASRP